ncbi:hypothetical protein QTG56_25940 (plasmid) [Rossellomorea sp. AcN35-11]|nr:hypothetical protein [Rossellomorea aquimaris]WJV32059.1 hypothetical protein QTG56_25940 [Rossellomorea sp. AcN35-11]
MKWNPMVDPRGVMHLLTDIEIKKVRQLEKEWDRAPFKRDKIIIELEILRLYKVAAGRKGEDPQKTLVDWLNEEEKKEFERLTDKTNFARSFENKLKYEVKGHRLFFESICRQSDFRFKQEVEKYLGILAECETRREVQITSSIIRDLLAEA